MLRLNLLRVSECPFIAQTYPPLALSKVFTHLTADGFMDVLAEGRVSGDPGGKATNYCFTFQTLMITERENDVFQGHTDEIVFCFANWEITM